MSKLLDSLDPKHVKQAMDVLDKMRAEYPAYRDDELLLYCLAQALAAPSERKPLP